MSWNWQQPGWPAFHFDLESISQLEKYIAITGASRAAATRDLAELMKLDALYKTGELRHTRYWLNIKSMEDFHLPKLSIF